MNIGTLVLSIFLGSGITTAAGAETSDTDRLCGAASRAAERVPPSLFFADTADYTNPDAYEHWQRFEDSAELERASGKKELSGQAVVWWFSSSTLVHFRLSTPSGDWMHYIEYCFADGGNILRTKSTLNIFNASIAGGKARGGVSRSQIEHFDQSANMIDAKTTAVDLETKAPVPKRQYVGHEDPIYRTLRDLPFWDLLPPEPPPDKRPAP
jgi:hypothetical protein